MVALLGAGSIWQGFQSQPPEAWRKYEVVADLLGSLKLAGTMPLFFLVGAFLLWEAWRMAFFKGRYARKD